MRAASWSRAFFWSASRAIAAWVSWICCARARSLSEIWAARSRVSWRVCWRWVCAQSRESWDGGSGKVSGNMFGGSQGRPPVSIPLSNSAEMSGNILFYQNGKHIQRALLFVRCLYRLSVLARNDLDPLRNHLLVRLHLERRVLDDERPHIVAQAVRMEVTLPSHPSAPGPPECSHTHLERRLRLDLPHHRIRKRLVELRNRLNINDAFGSHPHTCCNTFMANCGVIAPLVINSSNESVNAMPILNGVVSSALMAKVNRTHDDPR